SSGGSYAGKYHFSTLIANIKMICLTTGRVRHIIGPIRGGGMYLRHAFSLCVFLCALAIVLMAIPAAWPQATSTASLSGLVTDEQNAAVAGAEIRIADLATGSTQATVTNETGR